MRLTVLGCHVDNLTMEETLNRVATFISTGQPHQHVVINADKVVKANRDAGLMRIINGCDLINADGMPVVWASHLLGRPLKERVTGVDLFEQLVGRAAREGWRLYFLGAKEEVVCRVVDIFRDRYPALQVAGYRNGYWDAAEEDLVANAIGEAQPHILFVAISSPKKEEFLAKYQTRMKVPFAMGVGGSFDVITAATTRAPKWMQRTGFEWLYRFLQEPRRMFRRYFVDDMYFFWLLVKEIAASIRPRVQVRTKPVD